MKESINIGYEQRIEVLSVLEKKQESILKNILIGRVSSFIILLLLVAFSIYTNSGAVLWFSLFPFLGFTLLLIKNRKENAKLLLIQKKISTNKDELQYLKSDFSPFENGTNFIDSSHNFSHDLDVFGKGSLFQSINRTSSAESEETLAKLLQHPFVSEKEILERQKGIAELTSKVEWREEFRAKGKLFATQKNKAELVSGWNKEEVPGFENLKLWKFILWGIPVFMCLIFILAYFAYLPWGVAILAASIPLGLVGNKLKLINKQHSKISQFLPVLQQNSQLTKLIEDEPFESTILLEFQKKLKNKKNIASEEISELAKLTQQLDNRSNPVFAIVMNALFIWDLQYLFRLKQWLTKNENNLKYWFEVVYNIETFLSLATYSYNNPTFSQAIPSSESVIKTTKLAHPLLPNKTRIANDFETKNLQEFEIITGANMAGKSTFLRAIGINLILANCGAPVCAEFFSFNPITIFSSMRTSDSLKNNESYFYSELKRLQTIVEKLKTGEKLFVILDEILKGTNSKDKAEGSKKFVKQILKYQAAGIIATHDLSLCSLKDEFPEQIENKYFDVEIENDQLVFDYKLKNGICSNMNAEFLMKKMGITD